MHSFVAPGRRLYVQSESEANPGSTIETTKVQRGGHGPMAPRLDASNTGSPPSNPPLKHHGLRDIVGLEGK